MAKARSMLVVEKVYKQHICTASIPERVKSEQLHVESLISSRPAALEPCCTKDALVVAVRVLVSVRKGRLRPKLPAKQPVWLWLRGSFAAVVVTVTVVICICRCSSFLSSPILESRMWIVSDRAGRNALVSNGSFGRPQRRERQANS
jgi:hypothetical protein